MKILNNVKKFEDFNKNPNGDVIKEEFDYMIGINNFLDNPVMIAIATAWLINGNFSINNIKTTLGNMKDDFLDYSNSLGYAIDKDVLDYKFLELINKVKKIIKL